MNISRATLINYEKGHTTINLDVLNRFKKHYPDFDLEENTNTKPKIIVDNSIDFRVLANVLVNKKTQIVFAAFIFTFIGISSSFLFKKYYEAEITCIRKRCHQSRSRSISIFSKQFGYKYSK